jgi:hypothetical protein
MATIKKERPDLLIDMKIDGIPIPTQLPDDAFKPSEWVEGIGEPINAGILSEIDIDPTGWFIIIILMNDLIIYTQYNIQYNPNKYNK